MDLSFSVIGVVALVLVAAVAVMGAIVLASLGATTGRGGNVSALAAAASAAGADVAVAFRWVFAAGLVFLAGSLIALIVMEERPLRSSTEASSTPAE